MISSSLASSKKWPRRGSLVISRLQTPGRSSCKPVKLRQGLECVATSLKWELFEGKLESVPDCRETTLQDFYPKPMRCRWMSESIPHRVHIHQAILFCCLYRCLRLLFSHEQHSGCKAVACTLWGPRFARLARSGTLATCNNSPSCTFPRQARDT